MTKSISRAAIVGLIAGFALLSSARDGHAQSAEPDPIRLKTCDGLNLWGKWFEGGKGNKSDTVILVHAYGSQCSKGPWEDLAKALQKENYSVLMFDLRGHGKSAETRGLADWKDFCGKSYNKLSGYKLNPNSDVQEIKRDSFLPGYYPYLVNDLAAARRFVDQKNDANSCNSGRIFIVAEGSICPLIMMGTSIEFLRNGVFPVVKGTDPPEHPAGRDYAGLIFLSWAGSGGPMFASANNVLQRVSTRYELFAETKVTVAERVRDKVSMMFIYGKEDKESNVEARRWFGRFGAVTAEKEKLLRKYAQEVNAEKLSGIKMMDVLVEEKIKKNVNGKEEEAIVKVPVVQQQIISFIKGTIENGKNGSNHRMRNINTERLYPVPLEMWGLKSP